MIILFGFMIHTSTVNNNNDNINNINELINKKIPEYTWEMLKKTSKPSRC